MYKRLVILMDQAISTPTHVLYTMSILIATVNLMLHTSAKHARTVHDTVLAISFLCAALVAPGDCR